MKKAVIIFLISLTIIGRPVVGISQQLGENVLFNKAPSQVKGFNPHVSVSVGSSFTSFGPGINSFGTWVMPEISAPVTKKISVSAGIGYSTFFTGGSCGESSLFGNNPQQYGSVYVKGNYQINERVSVSALAYKTFNLQPAPSQEKLNPHALDLSNEGVVINLNYKVTDKFEINASFSYDKRNYNPYYYPGRMMNPGMNPAFGGYNTFHPGF